MNFTETDSDSQGMDETEFRKASPGEQLAELSRLVVSKRALTHQLREQEARA